MEVDDDDDDWSHLLSNCETGLLPVGFESVDDVAMPSSCDKDGLEFPNDRLSEGSEIPLAGSSLSGRDSGDESMKFSSASGSERAPRAYMQVMCRCTRRASSLT